MRSKLWYITPGPGRAWDDHVVGTLASSEAECVAKARALGMRGPAVLVAAEADLNRVDAADLARVLREENMVT